MRPNAKCKGGQMSEGHGQILDAHVRTFIADVKKFFRTSEKSLILLVKQNCSHQAIFCADGKRRSEVNIFVKRIYRQHFSCPGPDVMFRCRRCCRHHRQQTLMRIRSYCSNRFSGSLNFSLQLLDPTESFRKDGSLEIVTAPGAKLLNSQNDPWR